MRSLFIAFFAFLLICPSGSSAQDIPDTTGSNVTPAEAAMALQFHNEARNEVGVAPLKWSQELAAFAQDWANHLAAVNCKLMHRPGDGEWKQLYGENIFWGNGVPYLAIDASKSWYEEKKKYTYGPLTGSNWSGTGHYTQMVWRKSTQVGLGTATCSNGAVIIVANYSPSGNFMGEKPY